MYHSENCTVDINSNRDYFHQLGYVFSQITFVYIDAEISVIVCKAVLDLKIAMTRTYSVTMLWGITGVSDCCHVDQE